ncbi:MAG: hypothetical protein Q7K42_02835 [Candidatus Diapherotrites archaeon]|nr:hypothetical protein [Candidatus Diapherotrites archaeon]
MIVFTDALFLKISVVVILLGFGCLFFFSINFETRKISLVEVDESFLGRNIEVQGFVSEYSFSKDLKTLNVVLSNLVTLDVVFENPSLQKIQLIKAKSFVKISGKLVPYKKSFKLVAESVELV